MFLTGKKKKNWTCDSARADPLRLTEVFLFVFLIQKLINPLWISIQLFNENNLLLRIRAKHWSLRKRAVLSAMTQVQFTSLVATFLLFLSHSCLQGKGKRGSRYFLAEWTYTITHCDTKDFGYTGRCLGLYRQRAWLSCDWLIHHVACARALKESGLALSLIWKRWLE